MILSIYYNLRCVSCNTPAYCCQCHTKCVNFDTFVHYCIRYTSYVCALLSVLHTRCESGDTFIIPAIFFRKKGYINFVRKSVRRPCVRADVRPCGCASVTFLVNVSPPKRLDVATSNFVAK